MSARAHALARARVCVCGACVRALLKGDTAGISVTRCVPRGGSSVGFYTSYGPEKGRIMCNLLYFQLFHEYVDDSNGPILSYYCTCKADARTVGSCAHVASILWYSGYARHQNNGKYPFTRFLETLDDATQRN